MHTEPLLTATSGVRAAWGVSKNPVTFTVLDMTPKRTSLDLDFGPKESPPVLWIDFIITNA